MNMLMPSSTSNHQQTGQKKDCSSSLKQQYFLQLPSPSPIHLHHGCTQSPLGAAGWCCRIVGLFWKPVFVATYKQTQQTPLGRYRFTLIPPPEPLKSAVDQRHQNLRSAKISPLRQAVHGTPPHGSLLVGAADLLILICLDRLTEKKEASKFPQRQEKIFKRLKVDVEILIHPRVTPFSISYWMLLTCLSPWIPPSSMTLDPRSSPTSLAEALPPSISRQIPASQPQRRHWHRRCQGEGPLSPRNMSTAAKLEVPMSTNSIHPGPLHTSDGLQEMDGIQPLLLLAQDTQGHRQILPRAQEGATLLYNQGLLHASPHDQSNNLP